MPRKQPKHAPKHPTQPMFEVPVNHDEAEIRMMSTIEDAMHTIAFMTEYCREHRDNDLKKLTIADAFACLGGNTLSFCRTFGDVRAYEIVEDRFERLQSTTSKLTNIQVFNQNCRDDNGILDSKFPRDVIFLDPPWENPTTHEVDDSVFTEAIDLCSQISRRTTTKYVFMKLPLQYSEKKHEIVDNMSNYDRMLTSMDNDWIDISINTVSRMKKWGPQPTYSIVCAYRKPTISADTHHGHAHVGPHRVRLLLMQLATLHELL